MVTMVQLPTTMGASGIHRKRMILDVRASNTDGRGEKPSFTGNQGGPRGYKVALVTGANSGIGFVTAKELTQQGYYVVMGCRNKV